MRGVEQKPVRSYMIESRRAPTIQAKIIEFIDGKSVALEPIELGSLIVIDFYFQSLPHQAQGNVCLELRFKDENEENIEIIDMASGASPPKADMDKDLWDIAAPEYDILPIKIINSSQVMSPESYLDDSAYANLDICRKDDNSIIAGPEGRRYLESSGPDLRIAVLLKAQPWVAEATFDFKLDVENVKASPFRGAVTHHLWRGSNRFKFGNATFETPERIQTRQTLVSWAAAIGSETFLEILSALVPLDSMDKYGMTPLHWAAITDQDKIPTHDRDKILKYILEKSDFQHYNQKDARGRTAFSWAVGGGRGSTATFLMHKEGIDVNLPDNEGLTPLTWAARNGQTEMVNLLLKYKETELEVERKDKKGKTPLAWAAGMGKVNIVRELLRWDNRSKDKVQSRSQGYQDSGYIDEKIEIPLRMAANNDHMETVRILVQQRLELCQHSEAWLTDHMHLAASNGWLCLLETLLATGANVDSVKDGKTPLCAAAESGHANVITCLLNKKADVEYVTPKHGDTPIFLAVREGRQEAVKALLQFVDIDKRNSESESLLSIAESYPTIFNMISEKDRNGKLAETVSDLHSDVDHEFKATIVDFVSIPGRLKPELQEMRVDELLKNPKSVPAPNASDIRFRWYHLPANNMKWVEVLVTQLYESRTSAYRVLNPDRWVGRQHHGESHIPHARFMLPFCEGFTTTDPSSDPKTEEHTSCDKNMVLFMPYLHWEKSEMLAKRNDVINLAQNSTRAVSPTGTADEKLLSAYCFEDNNNYPKHSLHIRRTLDQFYYHTLHDTSDRDADQTVTRYQRDRAPNETRVIAMVDQLWLWVLVGPSGQADTVITCFPTKDLTQLSKDQKLADPDPVGYMCVLQNIMLSMLYEPTVVATAYDLAGLIACRCSRILLNPSGARKTLQFAEIYEISISSIMKYGTDRFEEFCSLINIGCIDRKDLFKQIREMVDDDHTDTKKLFKFCKNDFKGFLRPEIPSAVEIENLKESTVVDKVKLKEILKKLAHFFVLDITQEIEKLREIKDIQDELNIMEMVFHDQRTVLETMERLIHSIGSEKAKLKKMGYDDHNNFGSNVMGQGDSEDTELHDPNEIELKPSTQPDDTQSTFDKRHYDRKQRGSKLGILEDERKARPPFGLYEQTPNAAKMTFNVSSDISVGHTNSGMRVGRMTNKVDNHGEDLEEGSEVWGTKGQEKNSSLPLRTVLLSAREVEKMIQRAVMAYQALDYLVDLKQKQSNVMDARSTRILAEESLKMTLESEKQGKTLMVFTVVTIVFLPMSFMAAFFAINITQFQRDEGGTLGLGYVSEIMFPISAAISAIFIAVAFKAQTFGKILGWFKGKFGFGTVEFIDSSKQTV